MKSRISSLMDNEEDEADTLLDALNRDADLRGCWNAYHLIGDTLRGHVGINPQFQSRLMARLAAEPTVLAPHPRRRVRPVFLFSAAASLAAALVVGWALLPSAPVAEAPPVVYARNNVSPESVDNYLLAHHELAQDGSMQTAYYVRPVAYAGNGNPERPDAP